MANPTDTENYQFGLNYIVAQGDPDDPNTDWNTMSVLAGVAGKSVKRKAKGYKK